MWRGCTFVFFFFQAVDGIRDLYVTGVQTCALPISAGRLVQWPARVRDLRTGRPGRPGRQRPADSPAGRRGRGAADHRAGVLPRPGPRDPLRPARPAFLTVTALTCPQRYDQGIPPGLRRTMTARSRG